MKHFYLTDEILIKLVARRQAKVAVALSELFFAGYEGANDRYTLLQIEDIPDTMTVDILDGAHANTLPGCACPVEAGRSPHPASSPDNRCRPSRMCGSRLERR